MKEGPQSRHGESLDELVDWLREQRRGNLTDSFGSLLANRAVSPNHLVDLACIDLIERRRLGHFATAGEYLLEFPELTTNAAALDLIDAEICVAKELSQPVEVQSYAKRFPQLWVSIQELIELDERRTVGLPARPTSPPVEEPREIEERDEAASAVAPPISNETTIDGISADPSASFSVELSAPGDDQGGDPLPTFGGHRLNAPEWFVADRCLASDVGCWLIRGRDSIRGTVMAMKVVQLPSQATANDSTEVLNLSEAASSVSHPMWVGPSIAAIQHRHLSVIRPWVFAMPWLPALANREVSAQIQELATIAYCLEAGHQRGATHGAIHSQNVLLDHDGRLHLVDAISNRTGIDRWFATQDGRPARSSNLTLGRRKQEDVEALVRLIASVASSWQESWTGQLVNELARLKDGDPEGASERIGERLLEFADSPPRRSAPTSAPWYRGVSRWFDKR